jgi:hypothetical protein
MAGFEVSINGRFCPVHRGFWEFPKGELLVVFGGAGTEPALRRTRDEIDHRLRDDMSREEAIECVDAALAHVESKMSNAPAYDRTHALVVIRRDGVSQLYEAHKQSWLAPVDDSCQCAGFDEGLGLYFARSLFHSRLSMEWAKVVASHLIRQVKNHSQWSAGRTHLIEVPETGPCQFIDNKATVANYEEYFKELTSAMSLVLPNKSTPEDVARARVQFLNDSIRLAKSSLIKMIPAGSMSLQGNRPTVAQTPLGSSLTLLASETKESKDEK